jgi:hypothetical protein
MFNHYVKSLDLVIKFNLCLTIMFSQGLVIMFHH